MPDQLIIAGCLIVVVILVVLMLKFSKKGEPAPVRVDTGPRQLTAAGVFFAVFFALCAYGLLSAIVALIIKNA